MKQRLMLRAACLAASMLALSTTTGCELFGDTLLDDAFTVSIPLSIQIPESLPVMIPSNEELEALGVGLEEESVIDIPALYVDGLDIGGLDSRLTSATNRIESIEITGITLHLDSNSLNLPIAPLEFRIGDMGSSFETALPIAVSDELPAGFTGESPATIQLQNSVEVSEILGNLAFGLGIDTDIVVPPNTVPSGEAEISFTFEFVATVSVIGGGL